MNQEQLLKKISELETLNDQLTAELNYLDKLLKQIGFDQGLHTLKTAAQEMIEEDKHQD